ncbi:MAG TPA: hypothetical protein PKL09_04030 [bacterium]|nr:hypothetical protein [bacterium]HNS33765.1 hypothetical protein [bacterium]
MKRKLRLFAGILMANGGRLRAIALGPDGFFYVSTSNRDGRGNINLSDDKIIKINPTIFEINT